MCGAYYGSGYMQSPLGGARTLLKGKGELLGHSGATGSFAFYYQRKIYTLSVILTRWRNQACRW